MSLPHLLPPPPVVVQDPARCWAAAYESWSAGMAQFLDISGSTGRDDVIRWFESGTGLTTSAGRATDRGVRLLGSIGLMKMHRLRSTAVTVTRLDRLLEDGYLFCAYYWTTPRGRRMGHAVVIYGVDTDAISFMDPAPNRGLVTESERFFARESDRVIIGTSTLSSLARGLEQSFSRLGEHAQGGLAPVR